MSAACRAHHVCDAVSRLYGVSPQSDRFLFQVGGNVFKHDQPLHFVHSLFPASRNVWCRLRNYGLYHGLCARTASRAQHACDSKITGRVYRTRPVCFRDPRSRRRFYGLGVRRDGWQRSSLELHCRRCETAVVYTCIIGVPRGTGTKFYTRVSPFTASAHGYKREFLVSFRVNRET